MTLAPERTRTSRRPARPAVPPLENGDRLDRFEFERRYRAMPNVNKAELIEGVVYMPSPVAFEGHGEEHSLANGWAIYYRSKVRKVRVGDNSTSRLDIDNEPQPDLLIMLPAAAGGQAKVVDGYVEGAPEFVLEVASSSASIDLNAKLRAYERNGVREYVVWRTRDDAVDWFDLTDAGKFARRDGPDFDGLFKSRLFPGLWLDPLALVNDDPAALLAAVDRGCATGEHAEFARRLASVPPA